MGLKPNDEPTANWGHRCLSLIVVIGMVVFLDSEGVRRADLGVTLSVNRDGIPSCWRSVGLC